MNSRTRQWAVASLALGLLAAAAGRAGAGTIVVGFDDLAAGTVVQDGYGGITWKGEWTTYSSASFPPHSSPNVVYNNAHNADTDFSFAAAEVFDGAFFSGNAAASVDFRLYYRGALVATSATGTAATTSTFLASGYGGLVDDVVVNSNNASHYVMDDVTYQTSPQAVASPSSATLSGVAAVMGAGVAWRRRRVAARA